MSVADEAERARDFLAMAEGTAKELGRELAPAELATIGLAHATLAVVEAVLDLADRIPVSGAEQVVEAIGALTSAGRSIDLEVTAIRQAVDNVATDRERLLSHTPSKSARPASCLAQVRTVDAPRPGRLLQTVCAAGLRT